MTQFIVGDLVNGSGVLFRLNAPGNEFINKMFSNLCTLKFDYFVMCLLTEPYVFSYIDAYLSQRLVLHGCISSVCKMFQLAFDVVEQGRCPDAKEVRAHPLLAEFFFHQN